jgi:hypothetical protein
MLDQECTGIYCDILCNKSSSNSKRGWALNYFIEKGFTQQVIGDPKEWKETMEPIIKRRKISDRTVCDEFEVSNELIESLTSTATGKANMAPQVNYEMEPTVEEIGETLEPECFQDVDAELSEEFKEDTNSRPVPIYEGQIFIENRTTYVLHVTFHGENETRSVVGPKQVGECT